MTEQLSAAMRRFKAPDQQNPWYASFEYMPALGLGYEKGIVRRDPSCIIKANGEYYVWYTRTQPGPVPVGYASATDTLRAVPWDLADVWYATSEDGHIWHEQGPAIERGPKGAYDERSCFTPDVLAHNGRYYLVYQVTAAPTYRCTPESIAIAWADSPDGPWTKSDVPVVEPDESGELADFNDLPENAPVPGSFDSLRVHDPALLYRNGQYWLYYKGEGIGHINWDSKWGVAIADNPLGPYHKSPLNPLTNSGHEVMVWNYNGGVAGLVSRVGPEKNTIQYAADGLNFEIMAQVLVPPHATSALRIDEADNIDPLAGLSWGLSHLTSHSYHPIWQGLDSLSLAQIAEPWDFIIRWERDNSLNRYV